MWMRGMAFFHLVFESLPRRFKFGSKSYVTCGRRAHIRYFDREWYARETRPSVAPYPRSLPHLALGGDPPAAPAWRRGWLYYERFTARFPDIASLAAASPRTRCCASGRASGYYSRSKPAGCGLREVMERFGGSFRTLETVRSCAAWATIPRRRSARSPSIHRVPSSMATSTGLLSRSTSTCDRFHAGAPRLAELARVRNSIPAARGLAKLRAIMDFGALQCTPRVALLRGMPAGAVPGPGGREAFCRAPRQSRAGPGVRDRWFHYLHVTSGDRTLLCRRREGLARHLARVSTHSLLRTPRRGGRGFRNLSAIRQSY